MKTLKTICFAALFTTQVWAEAPVEDVTGSEHHYMDASEDVLEDDAQSSRINLLERRLKKLEAQIENINRLNTTEKIERLHNQLQTLQGTLEKQLHDMKVLSEQQKQFYQDLDRRIRGSSQSAASATQNGNSAAKNTKVVTQTVVASSDHEQTTYKTAFELYKTKQYDQALKAMDVYLSQYPRGQYAVNAYYWMGNIYYLQGKQEKAREAFNVVVSQFANSQKVPDALFKLAIVELDAGHNIAAKKMLKKIQEQYPGTAAARLAGMRYQELKLSS